MKQLNTNLLKSFHQLAEAGKLAGVFGDIDGNQYHRELPGVSKTDIEYASWSLANMVARKNREEFDSDALLMGRLLHSRIELHANLDEYRKIFVVKPKFTGSGARAAGEEWDHAHKGMTILTESQEADIESMFAGVVANPQSRAIVDANGIYEETVFWTDRDSGVLCKCRPDKRVPDFLGQPLIADWKTIGQFSKRNIQDAIADHHYHVSAAFTIDGLKAVGIDPGPYVFVFIEKGEPNRVLCVPANDIDVELGRRKYKKVLMQIAEAQKTGVWPGFADIGMHDWVRQREMEALA